MKINGWIYVLIFLLMGACSVSKEDQTDNLKYLALGDSYTIGESVDDGQRYPVQLVDSLISLGYKLDGAQIIARTGWTTAALLSALDTAQILEPYDIVTLLIGVNNQYRGQDINIYKREFQILVEKSVVFAGGIPDHVLVLSIPDWGVTPFASGRNAEQIKMEIDQYNAVNRDLSMEFGVRYIDVTGISRKAESESLLIAFDGLHPSGLMYSEWMELMVPEAIDILKN